MKAFSSPFRSLALLSTVVALHASCSIITSAELDGKPLSSTSSSSGIGGTGNAGAGGMGAGGGSVGGGGTGGSACDGTCVNGETCCTNTCFSLQVDANHCGSCDKACATGELCCGGTCAACCETKDCPTQDHQCIAGTCVLECTAPAIDCGTACAVLVSDAKNCGACGKDCLFGHECVGGMCQAGWVKMTETGALSKRQRAAATWTGSKLFIWGGQNPQQGALDDGALYDPSTDTWTILATTNAPTARVDAVAIAMNDQVLVWGGGPHDNNTALNTGKLYDLVTSEWKDVAMVQSARRSPVAVWTGSKVLIWGGTSAGAAIADGVLYDPATDTWSFTSTSNAPTARTNVGWAWSGQELLLFGGRPGGSGSTSDGYAYDPALNTWRKLAPSALSPRYDTFAAWTGTSMLVFGGRDGTMFTDAAQYDPGTNMWTSAASYPLGKRSAPRSRTGWTSSGTSKIFVAGGLDETQAIKVDCRVYDSVVNDWGAQILPWPSGAEHEYGVGVWTGAEFILWSGLDNSVLTPMGERYRP